MESTIALNDLQKLGHCCTITNNSPPPPHPVVLTGVADSVIDIGAYGKRSDGGTFSASTLYHFLEDSEYTLPKPASFEESGTEMPFAILGDEAFPLKTYLMKPLARKDLSCEEHVFNYRLSRARGRVECAFGVPTAKWRL